MVPRSKAGQQIVAHVEGASHASVQAAPERVTRLEKPHRDVKLGLRFGLHPQTQQERRFCDLIWSSRALPPPTGRPRA